MNWDALGAIAETFGAIGVIVTLVYLSIQLRQNTLALKSGERQLKVELAQQRSDAVADMQLTIVNNRDLAEMMAKVDLGESITAGIRSLSKAEQVQYLRYYMAVWNHIDANVYLHESELMDDEQFEHQLKANIRYFHPYWEALGINRRLGRPGFKRIIEESLAERQ